MRFRIDMDLVGEGPHLLPVSYQPEISSWIFKTLHFGSNSLFRWLEKGSYLDKNNEYHLYTFSNFKLRDFSHEDDRLLIKQSSTSMCLSLVAAEGIEPFITNLLQEQEPRIGDKKSKVQFKVSGVERLPDPEFSENMKLSCISPLVLVNKEKKNPEFLSPDEKNYGVLFFKNLMAKYAHMVKQLPSASQGGLSGLSDLQFRLLGNPTSRVVKINPGTPYQESIKGYLFDFSLKAPAELIRLGYHAGFGDHGYQGFGCCKVKK